MRDITDVAVPLNITVTGADPKIWVELDSKKYLLKWAKESNLLAPFSECVGSRFMQSVGVLTQGVEPVIYEGKVAALCEDIGDIKQFINISESSLDTDPTYKYYALDDLLYEINHMRKLTVQQKLSLIHQFKMTLLCDAILANRDRHAGNWGYRVNGDVCPVYDNGACLFPSLLAYKENTVKRFFRRLVMEEPKSKVQRKTVDGKLRKHNFHYLLSNTKDLEVEMYIISKINLDVILDEILRDIPEPLRCFYRELIILRFQCIIRREDFEVVYERYTRDAIDSIQSVSHLMEWVQGLQANPLHFWNG